ncbi:MetQ/NlpA family ABC transporter substrate-binding protein [Lactococcus fujiensis]|uniref:Lipoprotein n=1 Tax=Lactococcus fujiensis JCM 16395 TaxID=1291764 RepID=A0A2A5RMU9_9LACT|nr:MetQ/NlpA family ABC transporter substrate-binding protein [Lactococcus fujiensis]PCS00666.1 D-methionine-binding lipoprotein plpA precursor [Lactococcus fujiensis JCM 16395]
MNPRNRNIIIGLVIIVIVAVGAFFAFNQKSTKNTESKTVTIGIMSGIKEDDIIWKSVSKTAKDKYGITLKFTQFTDYTQPNAALANGDIDLNAFQHHAFLDAWNKENGNKLVALGNTFITPIHLYSSSIKDISEIKSGDTIAVPNDASNESRALYLLKSAGLIELSVSGNTLATVKDISKNPKNLNIKELDASQTARALDSVAASVINTNYATAAKLPSKDSIYAEPVSKDSAQWINLIAARQSDKDNETLKDVVKAYQSAATKDAIKEAYPEGQEITAWDLKLK